MPFYEFGLQTFCEDLLGYGWSRPEVGHVWSDGFHSAVFLPTRPSSDCKLRVQFMAYLGGSRRCRFNVSINGSHFGPIETQLRENTLEFPFEAATLDRWSGISIFFLHSEPVRPSWVDAASDSRLLNVALRKIELIFGAESRESLCSSDEDLESFSSFDALRVREEFDRQTRLKNGINEDETEYALRRAISFYMRGLGGNQHDRNGVKATILRLSSSDPSLTDPSPPSIPGAVRKYYPTLEPFVLVERSNQGVEEDVVLPPRPNVYYDPGFSDIWRQHVPSCFSHEMQPMETVLSCDFADLVINHRQFVLVDREGETFFQGCNPASLSKLSLTRDIQVWDGCIVLLQDCFDCGNVAHFLFDSVVRMYHWCNRHPELVGNALFVFGGTPTGLHRIVLEAVRTMFGIGEHRFLFPRSTMRIRAATRSYWFGSQIIAQHPANRMRQESLDALHRIADGVVGLVGEGTDCPAKIVISRSDAGLRRLSNEEALVSALASRGFQRVVMSELGWDDQIRVVSSADVVVAPHGMGMTCLAFNKRKPRVIEIFNPKIGSEAYALLCRAYGNDYHRIIGEEVDERKRDFIVDIDSVLELLG